MEEYVVLTKTPVYSTINREQTLIMIGLSIHQFRTNNFMLYFTSLFIVTLVRMNQQSTVTYKINTMNYQVTTKHNYTKSTIQTTIIYTILLA